MSGMHRSDADRAVVAATFDDADVARCYAHRPPYAPALFDCLLAKVKGRGRALDLGCGPGNVAIVLADHFAEVTALDPAIHMIEAARRAEAGRHDNIVWANIRAEDVDGDQRFDLVTAGHGDPLAAPRHPVPEARRPNAAGRDHRRRRARASGVRSRGVAGLPDRMAGACGRAYDRPAFDEEGSRHERWMDIAGRERFAFTFRQSVEDFIACQHSRATWARVAMGQALADEFDRDLEALMRPHARDGMLELELVSELVWGTPRASPR